MPFKPPPGSTDELHNRLQGMTHWGYTIYRTTYSAQSDAVFPSILRYLDACIKKSVVHEAAEYTQESPGVDPAVYEEILSKYQSTTIEDAARFDGASIESVRDHFEAYVQGRGRRDNFNSDRMCIVIDEECLFTLLDASAEGVEADGSDHILHTTRYVKVLEAWPIVDEYDTFPGWMKCATGALWDLWEALGGFAEMRDSWESIDEICKGVYCGP